jgi:hypothetical protein
MHGRIESRTLAGNAGGEEIVGTGKKPSIAYYISAHGYGHGTRSCSIVRAIRQNYPQVPVHIVSGLPASFLNNRIGALQIPVRSESFDTGMVQLDSIRVDVNATWSKVERLYSQRERRVSQEAAYLKENEIGLMVVDIPAMPIEAAKVLGIPCLAVGNFAWDWIYSAYAPQDLRWKSIVEIFRAEYAQTDLLLRLPFCETMSAFPHIEDVPLVASPGSCRREEIARLAGCDPNKKWILLSFTSLEWDDAALAGVEQLEEYEFFTVTPLAWQRRNIHTLDRERVDFSSVIASVDAVISKPGFGIISDCIVNGKPLIYADRNDFAEYAILETAIRKYLKHIHIPVADLYRGDLRYSLENIWRRPDPVEKLSAGGDKIAARRIMQFIA